MFTRPFTIQELKLLETPEEPKFSYTDEDMPTQDDLDLLPNG